MWQKINPVQGSQMPVSLDKGPSAIVPIRTPKTLREQLYAALAEGETVSDLTRKLWEKEIKRRAKKASKPPAPQ